MTVAQDEHRTAGAGALLAGSWAGWEKPSHHLHRQSPREGGVEFDAWVRFADAAAGGEGLEQDAPIADEAGAMCDADPSRWAARADFYLQRGLDEAGELILSIAAQRFPADLPILSRLVLQDVAAGRFAEAQLRLEQIPASSRSQRIRRFRLEAVLHERTWRVDEAAAACEQAIELAPMRVQSRRALARIDVLRMRGADARRSLETVCGIHRSSADTAGKSTNASQSLVGEFINELRSDPAAMKACRTAYDLRDTHMACDVVRRSPHYTGAAKTLFLLLRQAGALDVAPSTTADRTIPRRIVQFWDDVDAPHDVDGLMASWADNNPGWSYTRYSSDSAWRYLASSDFLVRRAWLAARSVAQRADLFRLAVLAREGGVYADADDRCVGSLDALTAAPSLLLWHERYGTTGNNFIACRPGHPVIEAALEQAVNSILRGDGESIWFSTGPGLLTRCAGAHVAASPALSALDGDVRIVEQHELKRVAHSGCLTAYKTAGRHWMQAEFPRTKAAASTPA